MAVCFIDFYTHKSTFSLVKMPVNTPRNGYFARGFFFFFFCLQHRKSVVEIHIHCMCTAPGSVTRGARITWVFISFKTGVKTISRNLPWGAAFWRILQLRGDGFFFVLVYLLHSLWLSRPAKLCRGYILRLHLHLQSIPGSSGVW